MNKVYFIGAGPGDPELITLKGYRILSKSKIIITAGSLVSPEVLKHAPTDAKVYDSSILSLPEIIDIMYKSYKEGDDIARLHTGDPSLYGAIMEQMIELDKLCIPYENIPGVTALFASAAALQCELTLPEISQTVIITRYEGRTAVPENFKDIAKVGGTLALYLSTSLADKAMDDLISVGTDANTPAVVVYRASWPDQKIIRGTVSTIASKIKEAGLSKHSLIIVGKVLNKDLKSYSKLYDPAFSHMCREGRS